MMTRTNLILVRQALHNAVESLLENDFEEGRLEAELLLASVMGLNRTELLLRLDDDLSTDQTEELERLLRRRLNHEPIAYIIGHKEFFGLDFHVTPATLIPRPETELLVEKALELARGQAISIADIGTGCGAIAVTLAAHLPEAEVYAVDVSAAALKIAESNAQIHGVAERVHFMQGDLLQPLTKSVDIILANLPYVSDREMGKLDEGVFRHEPETALAGGTEGMDQIERLLLQAGDKIRSGGIILLEIGCEQGASVLELAARYFPLAESELCTDLSRNDRVVVIDTESIG